MKFSLANIVTYTPANMPVTVTMEDPQDWEDVGKIAKGIHDKLVELIKFAKADDPPWAKEHISCSPQADDSKGRVFFVHAGMYAMLTPMFPDIVKDCANTVLGDKTN